MTSAIRFVRVEASFHQGISFASSYDIRLVLQVRKDVHRCVRDEDRLGVGGHVHEEDGVLVRSRSLIRSRSVVGSVIAPKENSGKPGTSYRGNARSPDPSFRE